MKKHMILLSLISLIFIGVCCWLVFNHIIYRQYSLLKPDEYSSIVFDGLPNNIRINDKNDINLVVELINQTYMQKPFFKLPVDKTPYMFMTFKNHEGQFESLDYFGPCIIFKGEQYKIKNSNEFLLEYEKLSEILNTKYKVN